MGWGRRPSLELKARLKTVHRLGTKCFSWKLVQGGRSKYLVADVGRREIAHKPIDAVGYGVLLLVV